MTVGPAGPREAPSMHRHTRGRRLPTPPNLSAAEPRRAPTRTMAAANTNLALGQHHALHSEWMMLQIDPSIDSRTLPLGRPYSPLTPPTHSLTPSSTHSLPRSNTCPPAHSPTPSLTTHSLRWATAQSLSPMLCRVLAIHIALSQGYAEDVSRCPIGSAESKFR